MIANINNRAVGEGRLVTALEKTTGTGHPTQADPEAEMFSSGGASEGDTLLSPAGAHEPAFTVIAALVVGATTIGLMMMLVLR